MSLMEAIRENIKYEEITVNDEEIKYKRLSESLERQVVRLEKEIERLGEELSYIRNGVSVKIPFEPQGTYPSVNLNTNTILPQGIQSPSEFRAGLEMKLREKALIKKEAAEKELVKE